MLIFKFLRHMGNDCCKIVLFDYSIFKSYALSCKPLINIKNIVTVKILQIGYIANIVVLKSTYIVVGKNLATFGKFITFAQLRICNCCGGIRPADSLSVGFCIF